MSEGALASCVSVVITAVMCMSIVHYARSIAVVGTARAGCAEEERRKSTQRWWRASGPRHAPVRRLARTNVKRQARDPSAGKIRQHIKQCGGRHGNTARKRRSKQQRTGKTEASQAIKCSGRVRGGTMLWDDGEGESLGLVEVLGGSEERVSLEVVAPGS